MCESLKVTAASSLEAVATQLDRVFFTPRRDRNTQQ
jgi:hypothetical protein